MSLAQGAIEQVSRYLADGFKVVRLRANTKRPFEEGWQRQEVSDEDLHEWVREGGGDRLTDGPRLWLGGVRGL
jgi:hypothetical protein